jgi:hypothetical protein
MAKNADAKKRRKALPHKGLWRRNLSKVAHLTFARSHEELGYGSNHNQSHDTRSR